MAVQGFFSPDRKIRMAGEKENNAAFSVKVEPVKVANNINQYNEQTPSLDYAPDRVGEYIRESKIKFPSPTYTDSSGDIYTKKPYTETTPGMKFYRDTGSQLIRKKGDDPNFSQQYSEASGRENFIKERNAYLKDIGRPVPRDPNKDFEGNPLKTMYGPLGLIQSGFGFRKGFQDVGAKEYASMMDKDASYEYKEYRKDMRDKVFSESPYGQDVEKKYYYKDFQKPGVYRSEEDVKSYIKDRGAFLTGMPSNFEGGISGRGEKTDDLTSMYRSTAGDEKTRLEKAKEEQENRNILQRVGDFVGDTFNKLTGTQAAGAETLQAQGINTSATTNISQMGNVSPSVQRAREAVEKSVRQQTGMPSNPGSQRQTGVGVSAGNLSRHKTGSSTSRGGISRSTSRGQGGGPSSRSRGGTGTGRSSQGSKSSARGARGSAGSRGRGGTGSGSSKSNTGSKRSSRGARKCDIRCKIDISPLNNSNLVKDNLAEVAYFVQEIRN